MKNLINHRLFLLISILILPFQMEAQIGVNNTNSDPDPSAMLDVQSTEKGMLMPRMTAAQRDAISNPAAGLMIYNIDDSCFNYFSGNAWVKDCGRIDGTAPLMPSSFGSNGFDSGNDILVDKDGYKYLAGGFTNSITLGDTTLTSVDRDAFVVKFDPDDVLIWVLQVGGDNVQNIFDMGMDSLGNLYVIGEFYVEGVFDDTTLTAVGALDLFTAKINPSGQFEWVLTEDQTATGLIFGYDIAVDQGGNSYSTGGYIGTVTIGDSLLLNANSNIYSTHIVKLDNSKKVIWTKTFLNGSGRKITIGPNGNIYVVGKLNSTTSFGDTSLTPVGPSDLFVAKLDPSGNVLWALSAEGSGNGIAVDNTGNVYVTGGFSGMASFGANTLISAGNLDIFFAKITPSGNWDWAVKAGGGSWDFGRDMTTDNNGNIYATGYFSGPATFDTLSITGYGGRDVFVAKYNSAGQLVWVKNAGGSANDEGADFALHTDGNLHITGSFEGSAIFGEKTLTSAGDDDFFIWTLQAENGNSALTELGIDGLQDGDTDPQNEIQTLHLSGTDLSISDGNNIDISSIDTDDQTLSLSGPNLSITDGNSIDISSIDTDTDDQTLSLSGPNLSIADGNSVDISSIDTDTDDQTLSLNGPNLSITDGNSIDISGIDTDTDDQTLSLSGPNLSITDGNSIDISSIDTDDQTLSLNGSNLSITDGNSIDISSIDTDTDDQTLTFSGSSLSISEGNAVNLSALSDNLGNHIATQILDLNSNDLANADTITANAFIGDGSGLTNVYDNLGNHIATQNFQLSGYWLSHSGANDGLYVASNGNVGIGTSVTNLPLTVKGNAELSGNNNQLRFRSYDGFSSNFIQEGGIRTNFNAPSNLAIFTPSDWRMIFFLPADNGGATTDVLTLQADGHVGIGTPTPDNELHVVGQLKYVDGNQSGGYILTSDTAGVASWQPPILEDNLGDHIATQNLQLSSHWISYNGTNDGIKIDSDNNVGIGGGGAWKKLGINGDIALQGDMRNIFFRAVGSGIFANEQIGEIRTDFKSPTGNPTLDPATTHMSFHLPTTYQADNSEVLSLQGDGHVGIGTHTPETHLEVEYEGAEIRLTDTRSGSSSFWNEGMILGRLSFYTDDDNGGGYTTTGSIDMVTDNGSTHPDGRMEFRTGENGTATTQMVINSQGRVGIGINNPDRTLHVHSDAGNTRFQSKTSGLSSFTDWLNHDESVRGIVGIDGSGYSGNSNQFAISTWTAHPIVFRANQNEQMRITANGRIGIGTNNPTKGKVEIATSGSSYTIMGQSRYYGTGGSNSNSNYSSTFSLYAAGNIAANAFVAHSDARIKDIQGLSNSETDLTTLMEIEVTDYTMKDSIAKGHTPYKKVIAQQVAEVYPQAVTKSLTEVVPDIYQRAEVKDGWIMLATNLEIGERVKLITETSNEVYEVIESEESRFKIKLPSTDHPLASTVFIYGREVNDFHTVDYEAISMLNVSATQEQQRVIEQQQKIIEELLKDKMDQKAKNQSLETRLQALEVLLNQTLVSPSVKK